MIKADIAAETPRPCEPYANKHIGNPMFPVLGIANGGNLVCISDANENDFVSNILPGQQFWLGYTDETVEGSFVWVDGSTHTYTKWSPTEPSNSGPTGNEDYTLINS